MRLIPWTLQSGSEQSPFIHMLSSSELRGHPLSCTVILRATGIIECINFPLMLIYEIFKVLTVESINFPKCVHFLKIPKGSIRTSVAKFYFTVY